VGGAQRTAISHLHGSFWKVPRAPFSFCSRTSRERLGRSLRQCQKRLSGPINPAAHGDFGRAFVGLFWSFFLRFWRNALLVCAQSAGEYALTRRPLQKGSARARARYAGASPCAKYCVWWSLCTSQYNPNDPEDPADDLGGQDDPGDLTFALQQRVTTLEQRIEDDTDTINTLEDKVDTLDDQVVALEDQVVALEHEVNTLKAMLEDEVNALKAMLEDQANALEMNQD